MLRQKVKFAQVQVGSPYSIAVNRFARAGESREKSVARASVSARHKSRKKTFRLHTYSKTRSLRLRGQNDCNGNPYCDKTACHAKITISVCKAGYVRRIIQNGSSIRITDWRLIQALICFTFWGRLSLLACTSVQLGGESGRLAPFFHTLVSAIVVLLLRYTKKPGSVVLNQWLSQHTFSPTLRAEHSLHISDFVTL